MEVSKRIFNLETETAFSILAKANNLAAKGKDIINLGIGQPDFPTQSIFRKLPLKQLKMAITVILHQMGYLNYENQFQN